MKNIITINSYNIKRNIGRKEDILPVYLHQKENGEKKEGFNTLEIEGKITIKYEPKAPRECGSRCWIEFDDNEARIVEPLERAIEEEVPKKKPYSKKVKK